MLFFLDRSQIGIGEHKVEETEYQTPQLLVPCVLHYINIIN